MYTGDEIRPVEHLEQSEAVLEKKLDETEFGMEQEESVQQSNSEKGSLSSENGEKKKFIEEQSSIHSFEVVLPEVNDRQ